MSSSIYEGLEDIVRKIVDVRRHMESWRGLGVEGEKRSGLLDEESCTDV